MADTVLVDNGVLTDYTVATDDISVGGSIAGQVQFLKLVDGTLNGTDPIPGGPQGLWVVTRRDGLDVSVASAGLTTATTAYTSGDQLGNQLTFANCARASGGTGTIVAALIISAADITGPIDLQLSTASITLAADNAAYAISDADSLKTLPLIQGAGAFDIGNNRLAFAHSLAIRYTCVGGTSLFGGMITRTGHTFFGAATDLQAILFVERD